jgi:CheY-like chemotaxis protein
VNGAKATILLVDSPGGNRRALAAALAPLAAEVLQADDAEAARRLAQISPPRLILCSGLPLEKGLTTCRRLAGTVPSGTPLLACLPRAGEAVRLRLLEAGADEVVDSAGALAAAESQLLPASATGVAGTAAAAAPPPAMFFALNAGEAANVLQFLSFTNRTGELQVSDADGRAIGRVYLECGQVTHVAFRDEVGVDALAHLFMLGAMEARFLDGVQGSARTIQVPTSHLLMEAAIRADEWAARAKGISVEPAPEE